ncbi:MAG TPA: pilin [Candidatus Paceibacterota bacterium]|nr:pilin [Candidatus Paceibacterota bacterium]
MRARLFPPLLMFALAACIVAVALPLSAHAAVQADCIDTAAGCATAGSAAGAFTPLTDLSNTPFASLLTANETLPKFLRWAFNFAISLGALLAVIEIAFGGWQYMTAEAFNKKSDARKRIQNALIGLLMLLSTILVLNQINPQITSLSLFEDAAPAVAQTGTTGATDTGTLTHDPTGSGKICAYQGTDASGVASYRCFTTLAACESVIGAAGNACVPYNSEGSETTAPLPGEYCAPDGKTQAGGNVLTTQYRCFSQQAACETAMPDATCVSGDSLSDSYTNEAWVTQTECSTRGPGWQPVAPALCGASTAGSGVCCGMASTVTVQGNGSLTGHAALVTDFPVGYWCADNQAGGFDCFAQQSACSAKYSQGCGQYDVAFPAVDASSQITAPLWCDIENDTYTCSASQDICTNTFGSACSQVEPQQQQQQQTVTQQAYTDPHFYTDLQVAEAGATPLNECESLTGKAGYEVAPASVCSSINLLGSSGICCGLVSSSGQSDGQ